MSPYTLYITEKASVGRALADVLPGNKVKEGQHIRCGSDIVAWASGHLLGLYEPDEYDPAYKSWSLASLPIVPEHWKLKELERTKGLLKELKDLLKNAAKVVHGADSDREGQLLIDEILDYFGWKGLTERLRINDVNPDAIRKALANMKDNANYRGEYMAGQARSRADWLVGMNLSRYCTIHFEKAGYEAKLSVGRVQTPTLGLVVQRDREIANFVPKPYYELYATLTIVAGNRQVSARWIPGDSEAAFLDDEGRLLDGPICEALEEKLTNATGTVLSVDKKMRKTAPPLPYNLAQLQIEASRKYDITDTLTHAQKLYEQGYITYPRSGCRYIPEGHHADAPKILQAIEAGCPGLRDLLKSADAAKKSAAWDDGRITEHHAIIPTVRVPLKDALSDNERKIYDLICTRYAIQFLPDHEYRETTVEFEAAGEKFKTSGREIVVPGWTNPVVSAEDEADTPDDKSTFPSLVVGESGPVIPRIEEKMTTPSKRFTYDGLITAMNSIHLYVKDPEIRKQLKELDGIGTSATQESIVGLLFERGYIEKRKKQIHSTAAGQSLIDLLNAGNGAMLVKPELTALWEQKMTRIEKGELELDTFTSEVAAMVGEIVVSPLLVPDISGLPRKKKCITEGCGGYLRHITKGKNSFFACSVCGNTFNDNGGEPVERKRSNGEVFGKSEKVEADCPLGCGKKARRWEGKYGFFWKCECSPDLFFKDEDGKPAVKEERPKAKCPVKGCKGTAAQYKTKDGARFFWKCETCKNLFADADGKPVIKEKAKKEDAQHAAH